MTAVPRGPGSPPILNSAAYPLWQIDVEKSSLGRQQLWISSYYGNPYSVTTGMIDFLLQEYTAAGFTIHSVTLYQEYVDPSPI